MLKIGIDYIAFIVMFFWLSDHQGHLLRIRVALIYHTYIILDISKEQLIFGRNLRPTYIIIVIYEIFQIAIIYI